MFNHLLVPLDGSRLAEAALPAAAYLAQTLNAWITLIHVIERNAPETIHGERHLTNPDEAHTYLKEIAGRIFPAGVHIEQHVHTSEVSDVPCTIIDHVEEFGSDLIVMCAHGQGGLRSWLFGSIAQQVIALGTTPVLLIHPTETKTPRPFACQQLLVPLDGDPGHEQGLSLAADLAQACTATLHVILVVPTLHTTSGEQAATAILLPGATSALLDLAEENAEDYLRRRVAQLHIPGISATTEVYRGDPAQTIVQAARRRKADLIVLGTHGKKGIEAFWSGSVAPKVSSHSHVPLLLVPVGKTEAGC